jgi:hypothetical protein
MPTHIRKYNVKKLSSEIEAENKAREKASKGKDEMSMDQIATGNASKFKKDKAPDYIAKAPRR